VWENLDHLGEQDPGQHEHHQERLVVRAEVEAGAPEGVHEQGVPDGSEAHKLGDVDGVDAPGVSAPGVQAAQARRAATPGCPCLAADLLVEGGRVAQRREDLRLGGVLDVDLPPAAHYPAGDAVIVVRVEGAPGAKKIVLVEEAAAEAIAAQDGGADGPGAAGDHKDAAVEVGL
jgi:hypothetical protein